MRSFLNVFLLVSVGVLYHVSAVRGQDSTGEDRIEFERDVKPLLSKNCWSCHGPEKNESGLRLDQRNAAMQGGDSGKSIVPGDSSKSKLIELVLSVDPDHMMPPEGKRLTAAEVKLLKAWIDQGVAWPDDHSNSDSKSRHWAYQPIRDIQPPPVKRKDWPNNPIDHFVLSELEMRGLEPSAEADRFTLIRRLYLDLIGLLPPLEAVHHFVRDKSPNAYESVVDELLRSPHFGERWGRHWLDMARYADSDGYEKDNARPDAYRWRDWVISAINQDMPFDQFTREQLAGDLLPNATDMQQLATAFHRQTLTNTEGGTDQEQFRVEACFDRTETTGAVWLGLTVGCARCHSHKYDAISQREYYHLFAFFNNTDEKTHVVPKSPEEVEAYRVAKAKYDLELTAVTSKLKSQQSNLGLLVTEWESEAVQTLSELRSSPFVREPLMDVSVTSDGEVVFVAQKDGSFLATEKNPNDAVYTVVGTTNGQVFDRLRLDVLSDKSLPANGPGRVKHGNFVLSEITLEISETPDFAIATKLEFESSIADHEQQGGKPLLIRHAHDQDLATGWAIANKYGKDHWAEFHLAKPVTESKPLHVRVQLVQRHGKQHTIGRFKISLQQIAEPRLKIPENIAKVLETAREKRTEAQQNALLDHVSRIVPQTKELFEQMDEIKKKEPPKPEISARVLGQRDKDRRTTYVLRRGEFLEPLKESEIRPSGLDALPKLMPREPDVEPDRLDLASWLVSKDHPLVPRVTVNHVWRALFGAGIVKTANDFGVRGELPSHPGLLDWLARDLVERQAWSRKKLIKQIVMSATYRQSSHQRSDLQLSDPTNQWLGRQNRLRVEGEIVRDICLDASGLLSRKIGGPSVYPALPAGVAELSYAGNFKWKISDGGDRYRRGMYTFFKRTSPHPNLIAFDCPDANLTCIERNKSNTPIQALVSLNNESYIETARAFAKRVLSNPELTNHSSRLAWAMQTCVARSPRDEEIRELLSLLEDSQELYQSHADEAKAIVESYSIPGVHESEIAAWIATSRILLNLDEFITRE